MSRSYARSTFSARLTDFSNPVVALDPGHGGSDSGAYHNGVKEKDIALRIGLACRDELQRNGVNVVMTRDGDYRLNEDTKFDLPMRVKKALDANAVLFVSLHANSAETPSARGIEVFYPNNSSFFYKETHVFCKPLAQEISKNLADRYNTFNRGAKTRSFSPEWDDPYYPNNGGLKDYLGVIRNSRYKGMPAILVEHGFVSNPIEAMVLNKYAEEMGRIDAQAILDKLSGFGTLQTEKVNGKDQIYFVYPDGKRLTSAWRCIGGKWYWFDAKGYAVSGLKTIDGHKYFFDNSCHRQTGWQKIDSTWYYFGEDGWALTGWFKVSGTWYYGQKDGKLLTDSWVNDTWYARSNGACYKNEWIKGSNGKYWYSFANGGYPKNGISVINKKWIYYFDESGYMLNNCLKQVGEAKYYFGEGGWALTGWIKAHGEWYYGQKDGKILTNDWVNESWYANENGVCHKNEWVKSSDGKWKYLTAKGKYFKDGINKVNDYTYYFDKSGYVLTNQLKQVGEAKYYFCEGGWALTGWIQPYGKNTDWYYAKQDGKLVIDDWVNDTWYANENGVCHASYWDKDAKGKWRYHLVTGTYAKNSIREINGYTYYFDNSGYMLTNYWKKTGSTWYYFGEGGWALTGWFKVNGTWYYAKPDGKLLVNNWVDKYWYARSNGACYANQWVKSSNGKYWYSPAEGGYPRNGISQVNGYSYYFDESGYILTSCWKQVGNAKYYFCEGGWALTGKFKVNGVSYEADANGKVLNNTDNDANQNNKPEAKATWIKSSNGKWWYKHADGSYTTNDFEKINGYTYYFDKSGYMVKNAVLINGKYYKFAEKGNFTGTVQEPVKIMGSSSVSAKTMASVYKRKAGSNTYPSNVYKKYGAASIDEFCSLIIKAASAEGVNPEVLFVQIMSETGWLKFGGRVQLEDCNFGGIGAVDNGTGNAKFSNVYEGLLAQAQHLKAYASKDALNSKCVDPRFNLVNRGTIPYVQGLGINDEPFGIGWATSVGYGVRLVQLMQECF